MAEAGERSLPELAKVCGTDKLDHGFCPFYERLFGPIRRHTATSVVEIGVFFGSSINMWEQYFSTAIIHGVDSFRGHQGNGSWFQNPKQYWNEWLQSERLQKRIKLHEVDQADVAQLQAFRKRMGDGTCDMILDDASHLMKDQQQTFGALFPLVKPGGLFIIEDVHSSTSAGYDVDPDRKNSTLTMINSFQRDKTWCSQYIGADDLAFLTKETDSVELFTANNGSSMTCAIRRKQKP